MERRDVNGHKEKMAIRTQGERPEKDPSLASHDEPIP
jgi:hypothetical protein